MAMRALVTGANGFVGRPTCEALTAARFSVRAVTRHPPTVALAAEEVIALGELHQATDWNIALDGVDVVVHLAGRAHVMREDPKTAEEKYWAGNVGVTKGLVEAAIAAKVKRFIFISTIKVNGEDTGDTPFTADDVPAPEDAYGRTKRAAEDCVRAAGDSGLDWVIIRPPLIYGPDVRANFAKLAKAAAKGWPLPLAAIKNRRDLVAVDNLASLIVCAARHENAANNMFLVRDGTPLSTADLVRKLAGAAGKRPRLFPVPASFLRLSGSMLGRGDAISRLLGNLEIDDSKTRQRLGWQPPVTQEEAFKALMQSQG